MGEFRPTNMDEFDPEYGGVQWKRRLNNWLEEAGMEIQPLAYEHESEEIQVTQENCQVLLNMFVDELDCVVITVGEGEESYPIFYFREAFQSDEHFMSIAGTVAPQAMTVTTLYPTQGVVAAYENFFDRSIPDRVPDELLE